MSFLRSLAVGLLAGRIQAQSQTGKTRRQIKRWVAPTLRELAHRQQKKGPRIAEPRSGYVEWNYRSELYSFGKRLSENFELPVLQQAFTDPSYAHKEEERQRKFGIEEEDLKIAHNAYLAEKGGHLVAAYVEAYLKQSLPKIPEEGLEALANYLLSTETLANVSRHLGSTDLIYSSEYPPSDEILANSLKAVIGALSDSSGVERAFVFIRDFICTQLNQKDLLEIWTPVEPFKLLKDACQQRQWSEPEPRLQGDCGKNTVLAAYQVGIYSNRQMLGKGFGETVQTAKEMAAIDALQTLFDLHDNRRTFDFSLHVETKNVRLG
ncbi:large ribosomal subunit protein mL44 [Drosophila tropicalis]|uniref:large ribosomal subunit protein mL44 n=1 Tax=Drosophila tropicalis TaxID=46794 RepID=UPI0035AC22B0